MNWSYIIAIVGSIAIPALGLVIDYLAYRHTLKPAEPPKPQVTGADPYAAFRTYKRDR